jgi:hypothetical protein
MEKLREKMFTLLLHALFFIWMWAFADDVPASTSNTDIPQTSIAKPGNVPEKGKNAPSPGFENIPTHYSYTDSTGQPSAIVMGTSPHQ